MSEQEILIRESQFPALSGKAFAEARQEVLASGQSVLQVEGNHIFCFHPDGKKEIIKEIAPSIPAKPGTIFIIR